MASERKILEENIRRVLVKEYLMGATERAGFGGLDIQRTPVGTRITLVTERPGLVIGRKGATINKLTSDVEYEFKFDNPQIEVQEVQEPALNAQIMAEKLASALERGWFFRRAGHSTVRRIMEAGAKGCLVILSGKVTGQRHRTEKFMAGHIKYCGEPRNLFMRRGFSTAKKKLGSVGVTVEIMDPYAKLPDDISILDPATDGVQEQAAGGPEGEAGPPDATEETAEGDEAEKPVEEAPPEAAAGGEEE